MVKTPRNLVISVLALFSVLFIAIVPLLGKGFIPTHDGEYHIIRFWQFAKMLSFGSIFPRWAPDLNSGYGLPLFIFHYPFPNYVGAFFHLFGVSFVDSFKLALAAGYMLSCLACLAWLKRIFPPFAALVGAIIFSVVPYWFVEIYVRGSVGEVWAIAWFFVALSATERKNLLFVSLATTFLILSHNIMAMLLVPTIVLYLMLRSRRLLWAVIIGILLSAYFWLPALFERGFMTGLNSISYKDHFPLLFQLLIPSWGTGFSARELTSDEMSYQIGIVPMIIFLLALVKAKHSTLLRPLVWLFSVLGVVATFLMLEISAPVWGSVGGLQLLQYSWRLLVFVLPATAFFAAWVTIFIPRWLAVALSLAAFAFSFPYMRPVVYAPRTDTHYLTRPEFTDGTSSIGNTFSTIWTDWKQIRPEQKIQPQEARASVSVQNLRPVHYTFQVDTPVVSRVAVNTLYYPGWKAMIDGQVIPIHYEKDGIIELEVPIGRHAIEVIFTETPIRMLADGLSFLGLLWLLGSIILTNRYAYRHKHSTHVGRAQPAGHRPLHKRAYKRTI